MNRSNYSKLFQSITYEAATNYIIALKARSRTLHAYDDVSVYTPYCTNLMHDKLVSAIELSVHLLLDQTHANVPLKLYETVKADRDELFRKYKKLSKKYRRLKAEL